MKQTRKTSNLAQSLGRITHVKAKTVTWLKGFDKTCQRDAPVPVSAPSAPSAHTLQCLPFGPRHGGRDVTLHSPLVEYGTPPCCLPLGVTCSFCSTQVCANEYRVCYNYMLPLPFVIACTHCSKKGGMR
jgi:hypothetical protein